MCLAVVHPFNSAQDCDTMHTPSFQVSQPYLGSRRYTDHIERDGLAMTFTSMYRPLSAYTFPARAPPRPLATADATPHQRGPAEATRPRQADAAPRLRGPFAQEGSGGVRRR